MTAHVRDHAAGLAALPESDPERVAAFEHAAECDECRRALARGAEFLRVLDDSVALDPPSDAVLERTWAAITREDDALEGARAAATRRTVPHALSAWVAVLLSAIFAWADARGTALAWSVGVECLFIELGVAAVPLAVVGSRLLRGRAPPAVPTFAALGAWAALGAQGYLHFRCPAGHEAAHLLAFHVAGVVLAAAIGVMVGRRSLARAA